MNELPNILEALIFASDTPLSLNQLDEILQDIERTAIEEALKILDTNLAERAFFLKKVSGGYTLATRPEYSQYISFMYDTKARSRLSRAALETLAIIAFKQPISRVEVAAIRGVNSDGVIKSLLERKLITIKGRDDGPGRSLLVGTTPEFLQYFSINDISELPRPKEIEELLAEGEGKQILNNVSEEQLLKEPEPETDEKDKEKTDDKTSQPTAVENSNKENSETDSESEKGSDPANNDAA